jgi:hypothetical protein
MCRGGKALMSEAPEPTPGCVNRNSPRETGYDSNLPFLTLVALFFLSFLGTEERIIPEREEVTLRGIRTTPSGYNPSLQSCALQCRRRLRVTTGLLRASSGIFRFCAAGREREDVVLTGKGICCVLDIVSPPNEFS